MAFPLLLLLVGRSRAKDFEASFHDVQQHRSLYDGFSPDGDPRSEDFAKTQKAPGTFFEGNISISQHFALLSAKPGSLLVGGRGVVHNLSLPGLHEIREEVGDECRHLVFRFWWLFVWGFCVKYWYMRKWVVMLDVMVLLVQWSCFQRDPPVNWAPVMWWGLPSLSSEEENINWCGSVHMSDGRSYLKSWYQNWGTVWSRWLMKLEVSLFWFTYRRAMNLSPITSEI